MCEFLSGIAFRQGGVYTLPCITNSHEDLIEEYGLSQEDAQLPADKRDWVRIEWSPRYDSDKDRPAYEDFDTYTLHIDESSTPVWAQNEEWRAALIADLKSRMSRIVLTTGTYGRLVGRSLILLGDVEVNRLVGCNVLFMGDEARVSVAWNTRFKHVDGKAYIYRLDGNSNVESAKNQATIKVVAGGSSVCFLCPDARIVDLQDGYVHDYFDGSTIERAGAEAVIGWTSPGKRKSIASDERVNRPATAADKSLERLHVLMEDLLERVEKLTPSASA